MKLDQPYGRLAKNLLERQDYPDPALTTLRRQRLVDGLRVQRRREGDRDKAILTTPTTLVKTTEAKGKVVGSGNGRSRRRAHWARTT